MIPIFVMECAIHYNTVRGELVRITETTKKRIEDAAILHLEETGGCEPYEL